MARSTWGSKRKRGDDCYELRYRKNGDRQSEYFHGTEKEADARLAELRLLYEDALNDPDITVSSY